MRVRPSLNVSLTPELANYVDARVASGQYQSASEVVRAGLRLLQRDEVAAATPRQRDASPPATGDRHDD